MTLFKKSTSVLLVDKEKNTISNDV